MGILRVGIAGYGEVGKRRKTCVDQRPDMHLVAVCDRDFTNSAQILTDGVQCHQDYRALLEEDLDVLIVCLTNEIAAEVTIAGLNKGMHVFARSRQAEMLRISCVLLSARNYTPT